MQVRTAEELDTMGKAELIDQYLKVQQKAIDWEMKHKQVVMDANKLAGDLARRSSQY